MDFKMNRPIKFRAWNHRYKKMFDVTHLDMSSSEVMTGYVDFEGNEGDVWDAIFDGKDYTLMQYTGLKDKNGKEIYEGDIVRYKERMDDHGEVQTLEAKVFYSEEYGSFFMGGLVGWNTFHDNSLYDVPEIIGNIYENPELLK
jgi:uncharacterized phage protein (TIGR01671 family)